MGNIIVENWCLMFYPWAQFGVWLGFSYYLTCIPSPFFLPLLVCVQHVPALALHPDTSCGTAMWTLIWPRSIHWCAPWSVSWLKKQIQIQKKTNHLANHSPGDSKWLYLGWLNDLQLGDKKGHGLNHLTVGTGGSPKNSIVWWSKCNKTPLFTVFSAHTQIASMLMLREHMSCLFATIRRFFMTCVDTFSSQHIETA